MSQKKFDLAKNLAKKIDNQLKSSRVPPRFGQSAAPLGEAPAEAAPRPVPFTCKLPAPLIAQLRERALAHPGGINALIAEALVRGLSTN
jgi:hypothetical protein